VPPDKPQPLQQDIPKIDTGRRNTRLQRFASSKLLGPGIFSLVIKVSGAGLSYLMLVAFARLLAPDQFGVFAFSFNLAIVVATIIGFGYSTAILRYWPQYLAQGKSAEAKGAVVMGASFVSLGSGATLALAIVANWLVPDGATHSANYVAIALLAIAFCGADFASGALRAQHSVVGAMLPRDVVWRLAAPALAALLVWMGYALNSSWATLICAVVLLLILIPQFKMITAGTRRIAGEVTARLDWRGTRTSLLPLWGASVVFAMIQQFDVVVVGYFMSGADTGAYFAAQKTATLLSLVLIAGGLVAAPTMAALYQGRKFAELQRLNRKLVLAIAVATIAGFMFLVIAGPFLLRMFNPAFASAYWIMLVLAFGCLVDATAGPTAYLMQMTSFEGAYLKIMITCYALVVALQAILIPHYGGMGAAIASATGTIIWNIWAVWLLRKKASLDPSVFGLLVPVKLSGEK
jgi:O-antigen/teichoic acid export membrane protein